jgi:hypothetical protein
MTDRQVPRHRDPRPSEASRRHRGPDATNPTGGRAQPFDTIELRWFTSGALPTDVVEWFTEHGRTGAVEQRCDTYRLDDRDDLGVKYRFGTVPEVKKRLFTKTVAVEDLRLAGRLEAWRKWSPADQLVDSAGAGWVEVHKTITKRRFSAEGQEVAITERLVLEAGTDVEIVAVKMGDVEMWSFAFAAYGPSSERCAAIAACCKTVLAGTTPASLVLTASNSASYPGWVTTIAAPPDLTLTS